MPRLAALLPPIAAMALVLLQPIPRGHGADEVALSRLEVQAVAAGDEYRQPVPAQGGGLSALEVPYSLTGSGSAELLVTALTPGGTELGSRRLTLRRDPWWSGLGWTPSRFGPTAQSALIPVPPGGARGITLVLRREGGTAGLSLYFSGEGGQRLPSLDGRPGHSLALRTEYGGSAPAVLRAADLSPRLQRWAPPWLGAAALAAAGLLFLAGGLALVLLI